MVNNLYKYQKTMQEIPSYLMNAKTDEEFQELISNSIDDKFRIGEYASLNDIEDLSINMKDIQSESQ
jgi:hypothetical protein